MIISTNMEILTNLTKFFQNRLKVAKLSKIFEFQTSFENEKFAKFFIGIKYTR